MNIHKKTINYLILKFRCGFDSAGKNIFKVYQTWFFYFLDFIPFLKNREIIHILNNGTKFFVRLSTFDLIIINELYIRDVYDRLMPSIKKNAVVIDVGGHIGVFSIMAAKVDPSVKVYAFEPFKENFKQFIKNTNLNNLSSHITVVEKGVGGKNEKRKLYVNSDNSGGHSLYKKTKKSVYVNLVTLEWIMRHYFIKSCDLLKIDCEGAEYEILTSTSSTTLKKIKNIVLEYHPNIDLNRLILFLKNNNYKITMGNKGLPVLFASLKDNTHEGKEN